jgi:adenine phosphoribosyltransferase
MEGLADPFREGGVDRVLGVEARGFIAAAPVAYLLGAGFVPVRKAGKLPHEIEQEEYELEYGTDLLEIHRDGVKPGERVLIVDDVLATGGTAAATGRLVERLGGVVAGFSFMIELAFLGGRPKLEGHAVNTLISYD